MTLSPTGATHMVGNQPSPLEDWNIYTTDPALQATVTAAGAAWGQTALSSFGARLGRGEVGLLAEQTNRNPPELKTHDRYGRRIDEVVFHPAWHDLMRLAVGAGVHCSAWRDPKPGAHVVRAALAYLLNQAENGVACPMAMTFAAIPVLRKVPKIKEQWVPKACSLEYDPRFCPVATKCGALIGMAMTEKQGGSDVRTNTTRAEPTGEPDEYVLTGHKWFCSVPMSDAFLTLAQTTKGLSCFFIARWLPDGRPNAIYLMRLKDKMGNRSNASAEIEYDGALATMVGDEGAGIRTIVQMVQMTRLDCALGSAALIRQGLVRALHHCRSRRAFGRQLINQPLMATVLADLALEAQASMILAMRVAALVDQAQEKSDIRPMIRLGPAIAKYWICKRAPMALAEAMECLGGNGYVEDSGLPRLYREAPVNSIWEGSGNVICLDVLRALAREPQALEAYWQEVSNGPMDDRRYSNAIDDLKSRLAVPPEQLEARARWLVERMALIWQAALLANTASDDITGAFLATRISGETGYAFGAWGNNLNTREILSQSVGFHF